MRGSLICKARGHRINRRRVWDDGMNYRTGSERCGLELIRDLDGWRRFDSDRDPHASRRMR